MNLYKSWAQQIRIGATCGLAGVLSASCVAQDAAPKSQTYGYLASGRTFIILGAEDSRLGLEFGLQRVFHEPRLKLLGGSAYSVYNLYALTHVGQDGRNDPAATLAVGAMYAVRFIDGRTNWFLEGGAGLQFESRQSFDLPSQINSTPTITIGKYMEAARSNFLAFRFLHVSNAGTKRGNRGQSFCELMFAHAF